jgi:small subunit ribosomal protein S21
MMETRRLDLPEGPSSVVLHAGTCAPLLKGGELSLAEVNVQEGETLEGALRRFKRNVQQEDIIKEIQRHSFYMRPRGTKRTKDASALQLARRKRNRDT